MHVNRTIAHHASAHRKQLDVEKIVRQSHFDAAVVHFMIVCHGIENMLSNDYLVSVSNSRKSFSL